MSVTIVNITEESQGAFDMQKLARNLRSAGSKIDWTNITNNEKMLRITTSLGVADALFIKDSDEEVRLESFTLTFDGDGELLKKGDEAKTWLEYTSYELGSHTKVRGSND